MLRARNMRGGKGRGTGGGVAQFGAAVENNKVGVVQVLRQFSCGYQGSEWHQSLLLFF
jgi:methyl coenzyme M reductase subunit C